MGNNTYSIESGDTVYDGMTVSFKAQADAGYDFDDWVCSVEPDQKYSTELVVTASDDISVSCTERNTNILFGDANGDGKINIRDVTFIQMYLADLVDELTPQQIAAADVSHDNTVNIRAATLIQMYIVRLINAF